MADQVQISSNARAILARFERLPSELRAVVKRGLARGLLLLEEEVKRRADVRFTGARSGLASRLTSHVEVGLGPVGIDGVIGFRKTRGFPYELAQEFGAKARAGGAMAIPVSPEAKALGQRGVSARQFPRTLFSPKGCGILAERLASDQLVVHYVFAKSIPPRLHFRETVADNVGVVGNEVVKDWARR